MTLARVRFTFYLLTGLFWFSTALLTALYVLYLMERGLNLGQVGLWAGVNTAAVILLELPTGGLADTWGRGRTFALANLVTSASLILMVLVPGSSVLYAGAFLFGTGRALSSGSLDAWFVDALKDVRPDIDVERELGPSGAVTLVAVAAGCLIGSMLPGWLPSDGAIARIHPFAAPLFLDAVFKVLIAALTLRLIREPVRHASVGAAFRASFHAVPGIFRSVRSVLYRRSSLFWIFIGAATLALGMGAVETYWQPRLLELSGSSGFGIAFGAVMSASFLAGAVGSILAPMVSKALKGRRHITALIFSSTAAGGLAMLSATDNRLAMASGMALVYFAVEGASVPRRALLNDLVPSRVRATMLSVDSLASYLGFAGIAALGFIASARGIPFAWKTAAGVVLPFSFCYVAFGRHRRNESRGNQS